MFAVWPSYVVGITQFFLQSVSSSAMIILLKPCSITSFFAAKPSSIAKKRKPPVIMIDADEGPDPAVSVADNAASKNCIHNVDVVFVLRSGEGLLLTFHVVVNPDDAT